MPKTKEKGKKGGLAVRRITSKKDRATGGYFTRLKTDEWLKAHALFTPDPEADKNPGYYEYMEHYDKANNQYVPCAGDDCYMCELGDNPQGRASTLWYFPENPEKERFKVLKLNGFMIRDFGEIQEEEGGVLGRYFRIKRLSDYGKYRVSVSSDRKKLTSGEIKALLKEAGTIKALDLEEIAMRQLMAAIKKIDGVNALSDDDDDDEDDEPKKAKKGKPVEDDDTDDDDEDENESEEDEDESEDEEDDDDDDSDDEDEDDEDENEEDDEDSSDDDEDEDSDDDDDEDESEDEDSDEEESQEFKNLEVVSTSEKEETISVKLEGKNTKLWVGEGVDVDFDKVKKGASISVTAAKDDEGDYVIMSLKVGKAKGDKAKDTKKEKPKGGKGKGGKGKK